MIDFLRLLVGRLRSDIKSAQATTSVNATGDEVLARLKQSLSSLLLAESALHKVVLCEQFPDHPQQIVIIGPTQVGKSSMVNLLLDQDLAESSAMAGFTVHCQGYAVDDAGGDDGWLQAWFSGMEKREQLQLDRQLLNEYSFASLPPFQNGTQPSLPYRNSVFWDTPDFDSIESFGYREPVLRAIGLADLLVFVVSKEKYADKTVWDMLSMLAALRKPVILVMNKTAPDLRDQLAESVENKYRRFAVSEQQKPELFFIDEYPDGPSGARESDDLQQLKSAIARQVSRLEAKELKSQAQDFTGVYWAEWTASVAQEHRIQSEWKQMIDHVCADLVARYQAEYLEHARHRETFQLALAELLTLLEVPGVAIPLTKIRNVVTWPMRKLISSAGSVRSRKDVAGDDRGEERRLLEALAEHGMTTLAASLADKQSQSVQWAQAQQKLATDKEAIVRGYHNGLDNYQTLLQVEIERAAQSLYKNLQDQPAMLNSLRAARVTGDAAAVVLAVKSGGLGAADLVIAPAMLSLTSMVTEGALGKYMHKVQNELRAYQRKQVGSVISRTLRRKLYGVMAFSDAGHSISQQQLQQQEESLGIRQTSAPDAITDGYHNSGTDSTNV